MKIVNILLLSSLVALRAFAASQTDLITINTSSLPSSTSGYIDWSFNGVVRRPIPP
jgi:hypothetical protein